MCRWFVSGTHARLNISEPAPAGATVAKMAWWCGTVHGCSGRSSGVWSRKVKNLAIDLFPCQRNLMTEIQANPNESKWKQNKPSPRLKPGPGPPIHLRHNGPGLKPHLLSQLVLCGYFVFPTPAPILQIRSCQGQRRFELVILLMLCR